MFTVVIAEKEHIDSIKEYSAFLKPFINEKQVAFCQWKPAARSLAEAVPSLSRSVSTKNEWRAIILCDNSGLKLKNPFEPVTYLAPEPEHITAEQAEAEEAMEDDLPLTEEEELLLQKDKLEAIYSPELRRYMERVQKAKFAAFDQAAEQPLTRLVTYLCEHPTVTGGRNRASDDPEFAEYVAEIQRKAELRQQIINGEKLDITLPAEVICVARRTCTDAEYDIATAWTPHLETEYSRFYDWNLYFDKMRYLVFDLLPENHRNYAFDYLRFLYALMLLANNELPAGAVQPNRVYRFDCENDEDSLDRLLSLYDAKLALTGELLEEKIAAIRDKQKQRLTDQEAEQIFCSNISVPVSVDGSFDSRAMLVNPHRFGLSGDCPAVEKDVWSDQYDTSRKTLQKYLKQPRRAVKRSAADMLRLNRVESDKVQYLNEFQLEDVQEHIHNEELQMVRTETGSFADIRRYEEPMAEADGRIRKKIATRMPKKTTLALGTVVLLVFLGGFLPLLLSNRSEPESLKYALLLMVSAVGIMAVVAFGCLISLRGGLRRLLLDFNGVMNGIKNDVNDNLRRFSKYLSHACNVMRGYSALKYRQENGDPDTHQIRVYQKHISDIVGTREELRAVFGTYMTGQLDPEKQVQEYPYDFSRPADYPYPFPYTEGDGRLIEFMNRGSFAEVPVDFVKRVTLRREELYD